MHAHAQEKKLFKNRILLYPLTLITNKHGIGEKSPTFVQNDFAP